MSPRNSATAPRRCRADGAALVISQSGETADTLAALRYCREPGQKIIADRQPARKHDRARGRCRAADPGRAGDRRRLDQGVHDAARRAGGLHGRDGAGARHDRREARGGAGRPALPKSRRAPAKCCTTTSGCAQIARRDRAGPRRALSRARHRLPAGARRRAEAQGNFLHPRRGLCRRRDEARADRADRRERAGHRAGAARRAVRQDRVERRGGRGARRPGHPDLRPRRRRRARRPLRLRHRGAALRPVRRAAPLRDPVQLLAYHVAVLKGTDVDQPRNLAKSVTVE